MGDALAKAEGLPVQMIDGIFYTSGGAAAGGRAGGPGRPFVVFGQRGGGGRVVRGRS